MKRKPNTALLVVDVQQGLLDKNPWGKERLVGTVSGLLGAFRERGRPVLFVRHDDGPGTELAFGAPGWEVARETAPRPGEEIFDKRFNSAFLETGLEDRLAELGAGTLVVAGMQTEYCIDATIKSAFERGFRVLVPAGGVATFDNGGLAAGQIDRFFAEVIWQGRYAQVLPWEEIVKEALS